MQQKEERKEARGTASRDPMGPFRVELRTSDFILRCKVPRGF